MHVLVTNDDGFRATGIHTLVRSLKEIAKVTVVAPESEMSATSHAITVTRPLRVQEVSGFGQEVKAYAVDGTPSDCVKLAVDVLMEEKFDLVVSGINCGPNLGTDVLYSGTVSGAIEGVISGFPAIAISAASYDRCNYEDAASFGTYLAGLVHRHGLPEETLLNVNVPTIDGNSKMPIRITRLGKRRYINVFEKRTDPRGRDYYWLAGDPQDYHNGDCDIDTVAVAEGFISITPLYLDLTSESLLKELRSWHFDEK